MYKAAYNQYNQYLSFILLHSCPTDIAYIVDLGEKSGLFSTYMENNRVVLKLAFENILNGSCHFSEKADCSLQVVFSI